MGRRKDQFEFSHDTFVCSDTQRKEQKSFKTHGCKSEWRESKFVVGHIIHGSQLYFCLNCDDWIRDKNRVHDHGWSLFDLDGNLNNFV